MIDAAAPPDISRLTADSRKDIPLEALRGIAAITVVLWHTMLAFYPQGSGIFPDTWPLALSLQHQAWFGLINGQAAVTLFFVLSGFVLTRRYLLIGDRRIIVKGALKRWPRLAGPVLVTVLLSCVLFRLDAYRYAQVGAITGSPWLSAFAYGIGPSFEPSLWDAVKQGTFLTFIRGDSSYDSSLWTMKLEFFGSFLCFGLAVLVRTLPPRQVIPKLLLLVAAVLLCHLADPRYVAFPAGVALAALLPSRRNLLPAWVSAAMIVLSLYLLGYVGDPSGPFALAGWLSRPFQLDEIHTVAAILAICAVELASDGFRRPISGALARTLGRLSFPIYLIHILVLCSVGCFVFLAMRNMAPTCHPRVLAGGVSIVASVLAALPLMWFNESWVGLVNKIAELALASRRLGPAIPSAVDLT